MKKLTLYVMAMFLSIMFIPSLSLAGKEVPASSKTVNKTAGEANAKIIINRLEEIYAMDKSNLSALEKRNLRKEVREAKQELRGNSGGIYLSVGAIIIIVLLLILLL